MADTSGKPASFRVFKVSELVAGILAALPAEKLLACKAVTKVWKSMIEKSPRLQQAAFQTAGPRTRCFIVLSTSSPEDSILVGPEPRLVELVVYPVPDRIAYIGGFVQDVKLNQFLFSSTPPEGHAPIAVNVHNRAWFGEKVWMRFPDDTIESFKSEHYVVNMLITQPPVTTIRCYHAEDDDTGLPDFDEIKIESGIRYGHLLHYIHVSKARECSHPFLRPLVLMDALLMTAKDEYELDRVFGERISVRTGTANAVTATENVNLISNITDGFDNFSIADDDDDTTTPNYTTSAGNEYLNAGDNTSDAVDTDN